MTASGFDPELLHSTSIFLSADTNFSLTKICTATGFTGKLKRDVSHVFMILDRNLTLIHCFDMIAKGAGDVLLKITDLTPVFDNFC